MGLGLSACDKSVQIEYERKLRPTEKQHQSWEDRVKAQLTAAYDLLEPYAAQTSRWLVNGTFTQADITVCVAWQFTQFVVSDVINDKSYPAIAALSQRAEALSAFKAVPIEPG